MTSDAWGTRTCRVGREERSARMAEAIRKIVIMRRQSDGGDITARRFSDHVGARARTPTLIHHVAERYGG